MSENCGRRLGLTQRCGLPKDHRIVGIPQAECLPESECLPLDELEAGVAAELATRGGECEHLGAVVIGCGKCHQEWPTMVVPSTVLLMVLGNHATGSGHPWRAVREEIGAFELSVGRCAHLDLYARCFSCPARWPDTMPFEVLMSLFDDRLTQPDPVAWRDKLYGMTWALEDQRQRLNQQWSGA